MLAAGKSMPASRTILEAAAAARMGRVISFLPRLTRQVANYAAVVGWLLHAVFKVRATKLAGVVVLAGLHLAGQAAAIFAIYWYARQMDKNGTLSLPLLGIDFASRDEPTLLWAVVIFAVVSFVASACSLFLSRQLILRIVEDYYAQSVERLVMVADRLPDPRARTASELLVEYGLSGLTTGCRSAALTAVVFANAIPSAIGGVGRRDRPLSDRHAAHRVPPRSSGGGRDPALSVGAASRVHGEIPRACAGGLSRGGSPAASARALSGRRGDVGNNEGSGARLFWPEASYQ